MREIGLSDVMLASPPCFPLSWETDNVSVHLSADYPVIWHQCHSLSQHNTPLGPLVLAWAIYGLSSSPNCKNTLSSLFHCLLSISIPILLSAVLFCERDNFWKAYCIRKKKYFWAPTESFNLLLCWTQWVASFPVHVWSLFLCPQKHILRY